MIIIAVGVCNMSCPPLNHCSMVSYARMKVKSLSHVQPFETPWTVAYQAPLSMGFSRQEYWSGLPFPSPGDLPNSGIEPKSPTLEADTLTSEPPGKPCARTVSSCYRRMNKDVAHIYNGILLSHKKE